jgi:hypothetical protein
LDVVRHFLSFLSFLSFSSFSWFFDFLSAVLFDVKVPVRSGSCVIEKVDGT